jgi:hypothetical protein
MCAAWASTTNVLQIFRSAVSASFPTPMFKTTMAREMMLSRQPCPRAPYWLKNRCMMASAIRESKCLCCGMFRDAGVAHLLDTVSSGLYINDLSSVAHFAYRLVDVAGRLVRSTAIIHRRLS